MAPIIANRPIANDDPRERLCQLVITRRCSEVVRIVVPADARPGEFIEVMPVRMQQGQVRLMVRARNGYRVIRGELQLEPERDPQAA